MAWIWPCLKEFTDQSGGAGLEHREGLVEIREDFSEEVKAEQILKV